MADGKCHSPFHLPAFGGSFLLDITLLTSYHRLMTNSQEGYPQIFGSLSTVVAAVIALLLPLIFLTNTTEFFTFPKQILIVTGAFLLLIIYCLKSLSERRITFVKNPLNLPVFLFALVILVSSYFSPSSISSLPQVMPVIAAAIMFFAIVNLINEKQNFQIVLFSLITGTLLAALLSVLSSFGVYLLPFEQTKNEFFNTLGSPIQMIGFLTPIIILTLAFFLVKYRKFGKESLKRIPVIFYAISFLLLSITIGIIIFRIVSTNDAPILLPFNHGFQLSLASISQNEARLLPSFLFGSGYGMFSDVFTKFHLASFNALPSWNLTFSFSSSFVLEQIATTGILGFLAFFFIIVKFVRSHSRMTIRPLFLSAASILVLSFIIPFSFALIALLFLLLSLYIVNLRVGNKAKSVEEIVVSIVTNGGFFEFDQPTTRKGNFLLPIVVTVISAGFIVYSLFFLISREGFGSRGLYQYVQADLLFAQSLQQDALTSGEQTYELQIEAIQTYPYRADFYRIFSQINLALATNLVNSQKDAPTVTEEVSQAIVQQLQQAINSSRQAVIFAPESSLNWRSLGQIYRNLIGVGENAEQFAIASYNQAIALEPNNPALRIELGGIYYQLKEFDLAQNQFQVAVSLKPDYANAYYNLGHALEEKGQLAGALQQYQTVAQLVANDKTSVKLINEEINALQARIGEEGSQVTPDTEVAPTEDTELKLQKPQTQFPERDPREQIPAPPVSGEDNTSTTSAE